MPRPGELWYVDQGAIRRAYKPPAGGGGGGGSLTPHLVHEQRSRADLTAAARKVGAHKMQPYRRSVSNKARPDYYDTYFMPAGGLEGSTDHRVYGGFWRNRPILGDRPRPETDWRKQDRITETRWGAAVGLDLWHNDILTPEGTSTNWVNGTLEVLDSVELPEFGSTGMKYVPMIDGTASIATNLDNAIRSIGTIIKRAGVYRRGGFPLVMSFAPESVTWSSVSDADSWQKLYDGVKSTYGVDTRHWHVYNGPWKTNAAKFDPQPFVIGHGRWGGNRDWLNATESTSTDISQAPAYARANFTKQLYCYPVATQDYRADQGRYWEAWCTEALRGSFRQARLGLAEMVQLITWNDGRETAFLPSELDGWGWCDLISFLIEWYKFDVAPTIAREALYLTHRGHHSSVSSFQSAEQTKFAVRDSGGETKNDVEALVFAKSPCDVRLDVCGSVTTTAVTQAMIDAAEGGPVSVKKPLPSGVSGSVSALALRSGAEIPRTKVLSPTKVETKPLVQNLWYYCHSSLRQNPA